MKAVIALRNVSAVVFLLTVFAVSVETDTGSTRVCGPVMLNWELNGCPSEEACMIETIEMASGSGSVGTKCPATCLATCSPWINGALYRSNNCQIGGSEWYDSGAVGCYCEDLQRPE